MNVPFSHPSELYPQKDGRKVRSRWEGTFTFPPTPLRPSVRPPSPLTASAHRLRPQPLATPAVAFAEIGPARRSAMPSASGLGARRPAGGAITALVGTAD